jgi:Radical SAM superfamily/4Fe-4S single cluster domain
MDTYCDRSWNWYLIDFDNLAWKMCCNAPWRTMRSGADWFNDPVMLDRRQQHLDGRRHSDCKTCWDHEDRGVPSMRQGSHSHERFSDLTATRHAKIELMLGNTCDMACRYCSPWASSIWAHRLQDEANTKQAKVAYRSTPHHQMMLEQIYAWMQNMDFYYINFTGGEPFLMEEFHDIIDKIDFKNTTIQINSNINTPAQHLDRARAAIAKLLAAGNKVMIRASLDGAGDQHCWQRQGADWDQIASNYLTYGQMGCTLIIAPTFSPLTLEALPGLCDFVLSTCQQLENIPIWENMHFISTPKALNAAGWLGCYKPEIKVLRDLLQSQRIKIRGNIIQTLDSCLDHPETLPESEQALRMVKYLDQSQAQWGGGDWRTIYPKTASICERAVH